MPTINFPSSPTLNQTYSFGGKTWVWNGTGWALTGSASESRAALDIKQLQSVDYSLSGGALTVKLNPTNRDYRSATSTSGAPVNVSNAAQLTLTVSSGSTLGTVSGVQSDIAIVSINNAGTMELAVKNVAGGESLDETGNINTVAEGGAGAADSANVFYSNVARIGVAYRLEGYIRSTQTTAGTWAQQPTLVQPVGGQALAAMSSLGYGQKYSNPSRVGGTTYYNTAGKPIFVCVTATSAGAGNLYASVNGVQVGISGTPNATAYGISLPFIVPPNASYIVTFAGCTLYSWTELS